MTRVDVTSRVVLRVVLIVVGVGLALYLVYLLRKPLTWIVIAAFIAVAISGPINWLSKRMRRGLAVLIAYLCLFAIPVGLGAIIVPPIVNGANDLAEKAPEYASEARDFVNKNERLRKLEEDYGVISQLEEQARKLPGK